MKRPLTTNFAALAPSPASELDPSPAPSWREAAPIVAALIGTLEAIEAGPKAGPAMRAHRSALRRQGEAAAALSGSEAMCIVLEQVAQIDPARAEQRLEYVREAWTDLPAWRPLYRTDAQA
jgi:hypothetical protein